MPRKNFWLFNRKKSNSNEVKIQNIIDNAKNGLLVNIKGRVINDLNPMLNKVQEVINDINIHRKPNKKVRLDSNDVKSSILAPIIRLPLTPRDRTFENTSSGFARWYNSNPITLDMLLKKNKNKNINENIVNNIIKEIKNRISIFQNDVMSKIKKDDYSIFVNLITDQYWEYSFGY